MPMYHSLGTLPAKRHITLPKAGGGIHQEQLIGNLGFTGPASLLYHLYAPTAVREVRRLANASYEAEGEMPLKHRHLKTGGIAPGGTPVLGRVPLLFNSDVAMLFVRPTLSEERFYRNGTADEVIYISQGSGTLQSQFGNLSFSEGDYLVIPRGILYRLELGEGEHRQLIIESKSFIRTPKRYRNEFGQLVEGAPFSERDIRRPSELVTHDEQGEFPIIIKQFDAYHEYVMAHHPLDVSGWDGYYYPWAFNIHNFEPIVGMIHQPPPIHQTFQADSFVICSFCPRPYDFHPQAVPAPYAHSNVMTDEVLYYASSEFMSRKGIEYGSVTLHPDGMPHGPHPGRYEGSVGKTYTDELAVMLDTFRPLRVAKQALPIEDPAYYKSWVE